MSQNQLSGAEAVVRMLQLHGVKHIFGLCGDTTLPLYDALYKLDHGMKHILTRDERSAGYMADTYARVSGRVGVCEGPSGGGATYILPGVVEANESSIPVLAITSDISVTGRGHYTLTELDQRALFKPLCKWNTVIDKSSTIPEIFRTAFTHMTTGRPGAAHIGLPFDVQKEPVDEEQIWADPALATYPARRVGPDPAAIDAAADAILSAKEPIFICGGGPINSGATTEVREIAEMLEIPVCTTVTGKGTIVDSHPLSVGIVGSNGGVVPTRELVMGADMVIFVGCRAGSVTTERWRHPARGKCRIVHIDSDPAVINANYQTEVAVVGDAKLALIMLRDALIKKGAKAPHRSRGIAAVAKARNAKWAAFEELARSDERPIRPERIVAEMQAVLPKNAVIVCDPGTPCPYFGAYYKIQETGRTVFSNRAHGALGYALPASVGAYFARPEAKIVSVSGDGSFGMCVGELETMARLNLPITMVVINNGVYGWIKAGQKSGFGGRYYSVDFSHSDHAKVAEAYGVKVWRVEDPAELRSVLAKATQASGPTLVDIITQPLHEARAPVSEWIA